METPFAPVEVFYSFAEADAPLLEQLEHHLSVLRQEGSISTWHKRQIVAGSDWQRELDRHLNMASLILLLISSDFLASDYCYGTEMRRALQRNEAKEAQVIPILLRSCDWRSAPFAALQVLPVETKPITTWSDRDAAWTDVVTGIRQALHRQLPNKGLLPHSSQTMIWNVPFARNPFFTGRDTLLEQLHTQFRTTQAAAVSQSQAISGLGGIGKTQLAIEYAYRYGGEYQIVLWARADTIETLNASYTEIAELLQLPQKDAQEQKVVVQAVKSWLSSGSRWLLILDNADNLDLVQAFLPARFAGHLLLTTRAQIMGKLARRLEVETLEREAGALLLLRRAGLIVPDVPLNTVSVSDQSMALALTEELGGLPLALDQAGAYIEETQCSLADYERQYQERRVELLAHRGMLIDDHPEPVATTWSLSFAKVKQANSMAAELLRACAFLAPDAIPEELLMEVLKTLQPVSGAKEQRGGWFFQLTSDRRKKLPLPVTEQPWKFNESIAVLRAYSLITRNPQAQTVSVHRLVQAVLRDQMAFEDDQAWKQRTVLALEALCPDVRDARQWDVCERWLPHALVGATWIEQDQIHCRESGRILNEVGYYLHTHGRYTEAESLFRRALKVAEQELGTEHPDIASVLTNLAETYRTRGKYPEAELLYQRSLGICKQAVGLEHPDTARCLNNLGTLYGDQRKYAEAEPLLKQALEINERAVGLEHPDTAHSLTNLADFYQNQGKYTEAESLLKRALGIYERVLGASHPDTAHSLNNLAAYYYALGKYTEAEPLLKRALRISEQELGVNHLDTSQNFTNLALLYQTQGKYAEAEPLHRRALAIREQELGTDHPDTARSLNNLADLYYAQRKYEEAEPLLKRALVIRKRELGTNHPDTAQNLIDLARLYTSQGKYTEAEAFFHEH